MNTTDIAPRLRLRHGSWNALPPGLAPRSPGLGPPTQRTGGRVALAAANREGVAVGFAVDSHDRHHEIIDPGVGCGRNIYRQRGGVVVGQRLFEF